MKIWDQWTSTVENDPEWYIPANAYYYEQIIFATSIIRYEKSALKDIMKKPGLTKNERIQCEYQMYAYNEAKEYILINKHVHPAISLDIIGTQYYHMCEECKLNVPAQRFAIIADTIFALRDWVKGYAN